MKRFIATVSPEGTITLPAEVREELGLGPQDQVTIVVEDNRVRLEREVDLERWAGKIPALDPPRSFEEIKEIAWEDATERFRRKA